MIISNIEINKSIVYDVKDIETRIRAHVQYSKFNALLTPN